MTARRLALTAGHPMRALDSSQKWERSAHAFEECKRQEREAVRGPEEEGHVQAASGEDRQLARSIEPGRQEVRLQQWQLPKQLQAGWHQPAEEGSGSQGRESDSQEVMSDR